MPTFSHRIRRNSSWKLMGDGSRGLLAHHLLGYTELRRTQWGGGDRLPATFGATFRLIPEDFQSAEVGP